MEDTELVDGLVLDQKASHYAGGVTRVEKAKIGLIQFCISPAKTDVSHWEMIMVSYRHPEAKYFWAERCNRMVPYSMYAVARS